MKLLVFIMSLLVLGLSCLPCSYETMLEHKITKHDREDADHNHDDSCSPFCHCTCCAGFSVNHFTATVSECALSNSKFFTDYLPDNIIEVSLPIWQPPQLS